MKRNAAIETIRTIPERCRVCYTCVRECPAKAIRIMDGQAKVLHERCIGCGNCVRVCSQQAKQVISNIPDVMALMEGPDPVAAIVAPSFPAEFSEWDADGFAARVGALGFDYVHEVAFGADLVARAYHKALAQSDKPMIATTCPAVVYYVEKYFPELLDSLAPIVSPMLAMARVVRRLQGENVRIVFIGPCTAKKGEGVDEDVAGEVDSVLTFVELRQMIVSQGLRADGIEPRPFDPPRAGKGALFPLWGGMLQAAGLVEDLVEDRIVTAHGRSFTNATREFAQGELRCRLLEMLACDGCISGAGMSTRAQTFRRRRRVSDYVRHRLDACEPEAWQQHMDCFASLDLSRRFSNLDQRLTLPDDNEIVAILQRMGKHAPEDELNCGACGYDSCREHASAIYRGLAESEMCLPYTIDRLNQTIEELADSNTELATTQEALMQSERLASMGQLAAGIAHEVNNPLGVVLMYAHLLLDDLDENSELRGDAAMIAEQADRCKKIVAGLLHFARQNRVHRQPTNVKDLLDRALRAVVRPSGIKVELVNHLHDPIADVDGDQLMQVLTNLISNAYAAMPEGGRLTMTADGDENDIRLTVRDSGTGIPPDNLKKIFEPFFTTKQIGAGTGLGLAVAYGVIKMHRGDIRVESQADPAEGPTYTCFTVSLPRKELTDEYETEGVPDFE